jgi:predicted DNA-binding protein (MmcQ/YjbR family)
MKLDDYNAHCSSLPHSHLVRQWGGAYVWKIDTKMFAIAWERGERLEITFKASEIGYEIMKDMEGLRPAPYLASRGMKWIQMHGAPGLDDESLCEHLTASYEMVSRKLTKKRQKELGLIQG